MFRLKIDFRKCENLYIQRESSKLDSRKNVPHRLRETHFNEILTEVIKSTGFRKPESSVYYVYTKMYIGLGRSSASPVQFDVK